ncbi:hypothetical protein RB195_016717 [Necator americanus]|uniref:Uncharacterized protein n=1 Tax=Necator americanus TaxID=51031 RepID=A0ABR1C1U1_NECAM
MTELFVTQVTVVLSPPLQDLTRAAQNGSISSLNDLGRAAGVILLLLILYAWATSAGGAFMLRKLSGKRLWVSPLASDKLT